MYLKSSSNDSLPFSPNIRHQVVPYANYMNIMILEMTKCMVFPVTISPGVLYIIGQIIGFLLLSSIRLHLLRIHCLHLLLCIYARSFFFSSLGNLLIHILTALNVNILHEQSSTHNLLLGMKFCACFTFTFLAEFSSNFALRNDIW